MKILLAQENKILNDILQMLLKSYNYEVIVEYDVASVLERLRGGFPDLILIDKNLKGDDGIYLSKVIKEDFITSFIPIIVLIDKKQARKELLGIEQGVDDYLVNPPDPIDLQVRIEMAVRRAEHQFFANSLTRLPGNRAIEIVARNFIDSGREFSFGYVDIDRFKSFNDRYGYIKGDSVIVQASQIIARAVRRFGGRKDFVGHIGGDDFVFITSFEYEKAIAAEIIKEFDRLIPYHYSEEDRKRGFIHSKDRLGKVSDIPLVSISVAVVNNKHSRIQSLIRLSEAAFEIKRYLKGLGRSAYLINRRVKDEGPAGGPKGRKRAAHGAEENDCKNFRKPLGQLLLEKRIISDEILSDALMRHWKTGRKTGETLLAMGAVSPEDIKQALEEQVLV